MKEKAAIEVMERVNDIRENALNKLTIYLSISAVGLFLAFMFRAQTIDWQDIYFLDIFSFVTVSFIIFFSKRIPYKATIYSYIFLGLIVVYTELVALGISGMGDIAGLFCIMLSLFYLDRKTTAIVAAIVLSIYGFAMYEYVYAGKLLSVNDMNYVSWLSTWLGTLVAATTFFVMIGMSLYYLQSLMIRLLTKVEHQKNVIKQQKQHIEYLANHDPLTGLPSRRVVDQYLDVALQRAEQGNHISAVLFLDLDGFKAINDEHGHKVGDEVLVEVANRISNVIRSSDKVCRIGGDEFLLIVEKIKDKDALEALCQRLIEKISSPLSYENADLKVGASIGAASYPGCAKTAKKLRLKADQLMYQVKRNGKNNYRVLMESELLQSPMIPHG